MKRFRVLFVLLALLLACPSAFARADSVTIMIYICASDLEREYGAATADINELLYADFGGGLNVLLETGGTREWQNSVVMSDKNQRYKIANGEMTLMQTLDKRAMTDPDTLTDFVRYCEKTCPADRYGLILWDHGGGALYGFGSDEHFPDSRLSIDEIRSALVRAGVHFDFIGFDACLMGTVETALALSDVADAMIASEASEPGSGWEYSRWPRELAARPDMSVYDLGRAIIDDYIASVERETGENRTLSLIDLKRLRASCAPLIDLFARETDALIDAGQYASIAKARGSARAFGHDEHDMVDLIDLIARTDTDSAARVIAGLEQSILYNGVTAGLENAHGLSVYFPYKDLDALDQMRGIYDNIGWSAQYASMVADFAAVRAGGQAIAQTEQTPFSLSALAQPTPSPTATPHPQDADIDWFSIADALSGHGWFSGLTDSQTAYIEDNQLSQEALTITEKNGVYVLRLTDDEWALIDAIKLNVFVDDGEGYIDMGLDDVYDWDEDGDLIVAFDYEWVALNDWTVPYYAEEYLESEDKSFFRYSGYVPILLNGEDKELVLAWDSEHDGGYVVGARDVFLPDDPVYHAVQKLDDGDVIEPLCNFYDHDGNFVGIYTFAGAIDAAQPIAVGYSDIGDFDSVVKVQLTDVYGNEYWTEELEYADTQ